MSEGQINRKVGQGMKSRNGKRVSVPKEKKPVTIKPTTEGQSEGVKETVLEPQDQAQTPPNLKPEIEAAAEPETGDLGASVADNDSVTDLEKALAESAEVIDGEFEDVDDNPKPTIEMLEKAYGAVSFKGAPAPAMAWLGESALGPQPDGSHKVAVTIQEGYWEAVQQWAEADGVPVEEWLSARLYEYVSTYGQAPRGR